MVKQTSSIRGSALGDVEEATLTKLKHVVERTPKRYRKLTKSMFPPAADSPRAEDHMLAKRFFPHLMNTSGFFVALFTKTDSLNLIPFERSRQVEDNSCWRNDEVEGSESGSDV